MKFQKLSEYFQQLESTSSRLKMTEILARLLKEASLGEVDKICYLSQGRLAPLYAGIEFNLAEKMMARVLGKAYGVSEEQISKEYKKTGDLGDVVAFFDHKKRSSALSVIETHKRLTEIALESGTGSVERKISGMAKLLDDLDSLSAKYAARIPLGKLRLGFSDKTILDALSWMMVGNKSKKSELESGYNVRADAGEIARIVKRVGLRGLRSLKAEVGIPIMPALCQRLPTAEEMIKKMGKVAVEPKFDGERLQVHFSRKKKWETPKEQLDLGFKPKAFVRTFTRNLENTTLMFPDLVKAIDKEVKAQEAILDCEAISFHPKTGKFFPFQITMQRKRKYEIGAKAKEVPLKFFCFDILFKDGQDLLKTPFNQRREILAHVLSSTNKTIVPSPQIVTEDADELRRYHNEQINKGLEGVVLKKWQAPYDPGRRGYTWVKFKQEEGKKGGGLADTLDCVVMGYYPGRGKRSSFGIGGFLVGVRGRADEFLTVSKIGTGLSDEQWREMKRRCQAVAVKEKPKEYHVNKIFIPDAWCAPKIMVVIEADNITRSPSHTAGYALRFPRLVRFRDDKSPDEATTLSEVVRLYKLQG